MTCTIVSSGRTIRVQRLGRLLLVLHATYAGVFGAGWHVSTCVYDKRFRLHPSLPGSVCGG